MGIQTWLIKRQLKKAEKQLADIAPDLTSLLKSFTDHDPFEDKHDKQ